MNEVRAIYSNYNAFVALTADNRVISWGYGPSGGDNGAIPALLQGNIAYELNAE